MDSHAEVSKEKMPTVQNTEKYDALKFRQTLNRSVINMFADLLKLTNDPQNASVLSNFYKYIKCFRHCLEEFPQIFVTCSSEDSTNEQGGNSNSNNSVALAFTEWLMMRLLSVLSTPYPAAIHEGCEDIFVSLLQVVRAMDPPNFRRFCLRLLSLMSDLNSLYEDFCNNEERKFRIEKYFSETNVCLKGDEGLDLSDIPILISDLSGCEQFQTKLTVLMNKLLMDFILFLPDRYNAYWKTLCLQIEIGGLRLKETSLNSIIHSTLTEGLPTSELQISYILDCLQSLVSFCCSQDLPEISESLEETIAMCLVTVTMVVAATKSFTSTNQFILIRVLENIMQAISTYGIFKLKYNGFRSAIIEAALFLLKSLEDLSLLSSNVIQQFQVNLCSFLRNEEIPSHEFLKSIFVLFVTTEVLKLDSYGDIIQKGKTLPPLSMPSISPRVQVLKLINSASASDFSNIRFPAQFNMKNIPYMWPSVSEILHSSLKNLELANASEKAMIVHTNIITTCLNILLQSSLKVHFKNSTTNFIPIMSPQDEITILVPSELIHLIPYNIFVLCSTYCNSMPSLYQELVSLCSCIISFQDFLSLTSDDYIHLCKVLSYPWMDGLSSAEYLDLQSDGPVLTSASCQGHVSPEVMSKCIECLSYLPHDVSPLWRCFVVKSCYANSITAIKVAAIKALPMFFQNDVLPQTDIWKIHKIKFREDLLDVQIEMTKIIGKLNCILRSACRLCRYRNSEGSINNFAEVYCGVCDIGEPLIKAGKRCSRAVMQWPLNIFLHSIKHENREVRKASVAAIRSIFTHNPYDEALLCSIVKLITDSDAKVRRKFSSIVQYILKPFDGNTTSWTSDMDDILMTKMREGLNFAKTSRNLRLQESILSTMCEIGKVASDGLLLICVISLLENLLSSAPSIVAVARCKMQEIALAKKFKMPDLFRAYREPICKFIAECLMTHSDEDPNKALNVIEQIYVVFGYSDIKSFLNVTQQYILPYLIRKENDHMPKLLDLFAKSLGIHKRNLLIYNFPFIFSHLYCHCEKLEVEKALRCVQKETGLEFGSLFRCNYQLIHNELLLHISTHYDQVFSGLITLALKSGDQKYRNRKDLENKEIMSNYLQPKLLGFLVFFDSQLLKSSVTLDDKKLALQSLICIMQLMGPRHITSVRFKIMATLRIALRFKDNGFPQICCRAWEMFVQSIEIGSLGPLINQVSVALLPLLDLEPEAVSRILHFLIIGNKSNLREFFHDLYFIPDIPQLQEINEVLKEYTENPASQSDFETVLSHSLRGVSHENLEVRMHAFAKLKQVLHSNQLSLHEHLLGKESVDHLLSNLISAIMPVCRESDQKARSLLAECLGALGAIDPGRLELKNTNGKNETNSFLSSVEDENFAFALLQELVHSFLAAADCRIQDCSAFAIQEALRIYKFVDRKETSARSNNLWKRFSPDIQEILDVLSNSQYTPFDKKKRASQRPIPIYQSSIGNTFNHWVTNWFSDLITKVKHDMASKLFQSCSMITKYDLNCTLFLLPHVVVYALIDSNEEECEDIVKEVLAVLQHCELSSFTSDLCQLSCQTIFSIFDYLAKWVRYRQQMLNSDTPQRASSSKSLSDPGFRSVNKFLSKIPQILLAKSSFNCHAYTRALMHLEQHLNDNPLELSTNTSFLQKLYAALDESDGVAGVSAIRIEDAALDDAILEHEATGDMQGAFACYEKAINVHPNDVSYYGGLLKCFIRMDQPSTALSYTNGIIVDRPEWEKDLNSYRVEAAWKLGSWNSLELFLKNETPSDKWNVNVGKILLNANNEDATNFEEQIKTVRCSQMAPLSAASMENGAYLRGYDHLTGLHMLTDIQQSIKAFWSVQNSNLEERITLVDQVISEWKTRQQLVQSSLRHQEPIFDLHRILLKMGKAKYPELIDKFDQEIASAWLKSAKLARKSGHQQRAYSCLLEAGTVNSPALLMEKTKWHWNNLDHDQAILCLQKGIKDHLSVCSQSSSKSQSSSNEKLLMCAKAKLLLAVYSEESAVADSNRLIQMYREIVTLQPQWEESHFHLAKYYDKMLPAIQDEKTKADVMVHICKNFGTSLRYGCKHVYHSLPRLLDIWFDIGSQVAELQRAKKGSNPDRNMEMALNQLTTIVIPELYDRLPLFLFMTAFPQMISRICHSHTHVSELLQKIIAKTLVAHSQQAIWMMIAVIKSSYPMRVQRCKKIFQEAVLLKPDLSKFIQDTTKLSDKLLELSNKIVKESTLSIKDYFQALPRMVEDRNFSDVMLPLQTQMIVTLPSGHLSHSSHNPFPFTPICIKGFQDTVEIFSSLQRPKKLIIKGSDGKQYGIICKPKDDLRKDCRLMEFNNLVNRYLKSDPEARKRQLYVRTYAVVPLNEECGLIEWVPNLSGFRLILTKIYKSQGLYVTGREIKAMMPHRTASTEQKLNIFKNKFLPKFPPVFRQWFLSTFPDPTAWFLARLTYARTAAVMSMVGYIVGLGDRHGENILFDASCGDIVHVDLNCLFNKGETMECPECVPFRLTHNMVDAMGPTGYEGVFRKSCEVTMKIMRNRTDALMSVLRPFIHDPLVEWSRTPKASRSHPLTAGELTNEMGLTHVKDIELRLKGIIKAKNKPQGLPLSIEGQVNYLIQEASDLRNLSQMYIGWTPHM